MTEPVPWDCHVHVIGDRERFPLSPIRGYEPPDAPLSALLVHLDALGTKRAVIVQPSVYGFDNGCLLDAIARSDGRLIGVVVPGPETAAAELDRLHRGGVRGIRCNLLNPGGLTLDQTEAWWPWMRDRGWHLQLQIDATRTDMAAVTSRTGIPDLVVDHMGYPPHGSTPRDIASFLEVFSSGRIHVKLSAPYRLSNAAPPYEDASKLASALLSARADKCLFASDWPHTDTLIPPMPASDWLGHLRRLAGSDFDRMQDAAHDFYGSAARAP